MTRHGLPSARKTSLFVNMPNRSWPVSYNAPFALSFALVCVAVFLLGLATQGWSNRYIFSLGGDMSWSNPLTYARMFLHVLGHGSMQHLVLNMAIILLITPMLEEKYGPYRLLTVAAVTAVVTAGVKLLLFPGLLLGASGVAFAFIILSSFAKAKARTIPLTFILIAVLFLGNEIYLALQYREDSVAIARFAHIIGGVAGGFFGFKWLGAR